MLVQALERAGEGGVAIRLGFTATKRLGNAVARNRAKRRLREAARLLAPLHALPGCDYVFIARNGSTTRAWGRLLDDVKSALIRLAADLRAQSRRAPSGEPLPPPQDAGPPEPDVKRYP